MWSSHINSNSSKVTNNRIIHCLSLLLKLLLMLIAVLIKFVVSYQEFKTHLLPYSKGLWITHELYQLIKSINMRVILLENNKIVRIKMSLLITWTYEANLLRVNGYSNFIIIPLLWLHGYRYLNFYTVLWCSNACVFFVAMQ